MKRTLTDIGRPRGVAEVNGPVAPMTFDMDPKPCLERGCGLHVQVGSRCPTHELAYQQSRQERMPKA
jgi:hypothetical protein